MSVASVRNLHKSFGSRNLFDGVSFSLDAGEKTGFIGANGSGKTTLFRMMAGEESMDAGTLSLARGLSTGYLAQEPRFPAGSTILGAVAAGEPELVETIAAYHEVATKLARGDGDAERLLARQGGVMSRIDALGGWDYEHRLETMLTRLQVEGWQRPVDALSGGEKKRVALARVLLQQPDLLLLDEPTNHLDADTTLWLEQYLLDYAGAVRLITHDRYFLDRVVTRMIEVNRAELTVFQGGYTEYLEAKAAREERLATEEQKRSRLIEQELAWVRRSPSARTGKQKARIKRLDDSLAGQEAQRTPETDAGGLRFGQPPRLGRTVLELHHISKGYGARTLIRDFSTLLRAGERVGVVGPNGAGKTTLLRIILGLETPDSGDVVLGKNTHPAYFDQKRADLDPDSSILDAVAQQDWVEAGGSRVHRRSYLHSFLFPTEMHEQRVSSLSGGERNRLLLARLLLEDANLLVLDEPTNDLDLTTLQVLESALVDFGGCAIVVTHDRYFLDKVATALLVFEDDGLVRRHEGGYDLYRRLREEEARLAAGATAAPKPRAPADAKGNPPAAADARPRKLSYREKQELEAIESEIVAAEAERDSLGAQLSDPALYADEPDRVAGISAEFNASRERVERLYARWAELETKAGN